MWGVKAGTWDCCYLYGGGVAISKGCTICSQAGKGLLKGAACIRFVNLVGIGHKRASELFNAQNLPQINDPTTEKIYDFFPFHLKIQYLPAMRNIVLFISFFVGFITNIPISKFDGGNLNSILKCLCTLFVS